MNTIFAPNDEEINKRMLKLQKHTGNVEVQRDIVIEVQAFDARVWCASIKVKTCK